MTFNLIICLLLLNAILSIALSCLYCGLKFSQYTFLCYLEVSDGEPTEALTITEGRDDISGKDEKPLKHAFESSSCMLDSAEGRYAVF